MRTYQTASGKKYRASRKKRDTLDLQAILTEPYRWQVEALKKLKLETGVSVNHNIRHALTEWLRQKSIYPSG